MRKIFAFCFILFTLCSIGIAQNTQPPAYVIMQAYSIPLDDKVCEPLTYIDSETGQGNLVATIVEAVKNKQIVAYSPEDGSENVALSWDEIQDALGRTFDTTYVVDYGLNGEIYTGDLVIENPYELNNVKKVYLNYLTSFDANRNQISQQLIELSLVSLVVDEDGYERGYKRAFVVKMSDLGLKNLLTQQNSMLPGFLHRSFLDLLSSIQSKSFLSIENFVSFSRVNELVGENKFVQNINNENSNLPNLINEKKGSLVIQKIVIPEEEFGKEPLYCNYFEPSYGRIDSLVLNSGDLSAFPLFFPFSEIGGYKSLYCIIVESVRNNNLDFFETDSKSFFDLRMDSASVFSRFITNDTVKAYEYNADGSEELVRLVMESVVTMNSFFILEYTEGKSRIPIAVCPVAQDYNQHGERITEPRPLCWIPLNSSFRSSLEKQEAYWPGKLPVMSLWDYFCANYYGGEIISEQKITQAEWNKMLEVLSN
ncbi:MAG: hypothetical protein CVU11_15570 [Bacteroidetes bacterium HGW-Bacteroidetes-6]|jgi:hypothetical protein|nr:MAG: hypothetical protein CVU11_15570 [Bacteroidetes bacterium HGW-Bacteroidetes-6]